MRGLPGGLFGGGSAGAPDWTFATARRFADAGLVAVAVEYRLSTGKVTPVDALADACAALAWIRSSAEEFGLTGLPATPPTSIVHGERDTLTPLAGARRYGDALTARGRRCELHVYPGLGHLLTRNLENQESDFDPDPAARADGMARHDSFLKSLGFVSDR